MGKKIKGENAGMYMESQDCSIMTLHQQPKQKKKTKNIMSFKIIIYRKPNQGENKIPFEQKEILNGQRKKEGDSREERTKHCQTGCSNANSMEKVLFELQDTQLETSLNDIYTSGSVLIQAFPNIFSIYSIFFFAHCTFRLTPPALHPS